MPARLDERLARLKGELDDHSRVATHLGLDFERPIRALGDGYPENTVALVGKITERLLKQLWTHHDIPGDPGGKMLSQLIKGCQPHIRSSTVLDALGDIQRLRNRSTHDGYEIVEEDGLLAVRRLVDVLAWFTSTGSEALTGAAPQLGRLVAARSEFLSGLYVTMGFRLAKRFVLSAHTVYELFCREVGLRVEYVELLLSRDSAELRQVFESTGGELLRTSLPKLTRFLVLEAGEDAAALLGPLGVDYRVVAYDRFIDTIVDVSGHLAAALSAASPSPATTASTSGRGPELLPLSGGLLDADERSGQTQVTEVGDAAGLLRRVVDEGANLLVVGRPGSGKTTLLKDLVAEGPAAAVRRFRFYLDMSLKGRDESFDEYIIRILAPHMAVERTRVFDVFLYLIRSGSVVCVLDGIDEAVTEMSLGAFLDLFAEVTQVLSAESVVVMSSRVSFLEDSPQVRRLLDGTTMISEQLVQQLHASGVDPLRLPRFHVLRLNDITLSTGGGEGDGGSAAVLASPLELRLAEFPSPDGTRARSAAPLAELIGQRIADVVDDAGGYGLLGRLTDFFGRAFLADRRVFSLVEVCNAVGMDCFTGGVLSLDAFRLAPLFRPVGADRVGFAHSAYQELLAARFLAIPGGLEAAAEMDAPLLTEQVRAFLTHLSTHASATPEWDPTEVASSDADVPPAGHDDDGVLPAGAYLVGPPGRLLVRRIAKPVRFDRFPVTVARYRRFLIAVAEHGSSQWDHPDQPDGITHQPWAQRMRIPDYYDNPRYDNYPATCINWWDAYAFARWEGKRLATSLEWEAAARGRDGRLFPWGDSLDLSALNCADSWSAQALVTYEAWKAELDRGGLRDAHPTPVDAHPANRSPYGIREMAGDVWELTATVVEEHEDVVICGGSYDNPARAVQTSSKGLYRRRGASNAVGFRCVKDLPP